MSKRKKCTKNEDNSSEMSYNGSTTNHKLKELLSYEYKYTRIGNNCQ